MSERKYTPGPWKIYDPACGKDYYPGIEAANISKSIVVFGTNIDDQAGVRGDSRTERMANAKLIAAAPDLLEALIAVVAIADRQTVEFDKAKAAIQKATS